MDDLSFFDKLRTQIRLFLMGNREIIVLFGIVILTASVIYSTKIITFPTRVPTRATESASGEPTPTLVPAITTISTPTIFPTVITPRGFLELLQLSPTPSATNGPTSAPTPSPTVILTPPQTPFVPGGTIFLPPVQR